MRRDFKKGKWVELNMLELNKADWDKLIKPKASGSGNYSKNLNYYRSTIRTNLDYEIKYYYLNVKELT